MMVAGELERTVRNGCCSREGRAESSGEGGRLCTKGGPDQGPKGQEEIALCSIENNTTKISLTPIPRGQVSVGQSQISLLSWLWPVMSIDEVIDFVCSELRLLEKEDNVDS